MCSEDPGDLLNPGPEPATPALHPFLVAQMVKSPPAMQETRVQSVGREDPLEESMATHSSILSWKIPWTEEPGGLLPMRLKRVRQD